MTPTALTGGMEMENADAILRELVEAIERRWKDETPRKRSNAVSPRMEEAIHRAKLHLGIPSDYRPEE
jgi:hypothetical protein